MNLPSNIRGGSTCSYSIGDQVGVVQAGRLNNNSDVIDMAIENRIQQPNLPPPPLSQINSADPQIIILPIVQVQSSPGRNGMPSQTATVEGFAMLWMIYFPPTGGSLTGEFIQFISNYGVGGAQSAYGAFSKPYLVD